MFCKHMQKLTETRKNKYKKRLESLLNLQIPFKKITQTSIHWSRSISVFCEPLWNTSVFLCSFSWQCVDINIKSCWSMLSTPSNPSVTTEKKKINLFCYSQICVCFALLFNLWSRDLMSTFPSDSTHSYLRSPSQLTAAKRGVQNKQMWLSN